MTTTTAAHASRQAILWAITVSSRTLGVERGLSSAASARDVAGDPLLDLADDAPRRPATPAAG